MSRTVPKTFRKAMVAAVFLMLVSPGAGRADPILTPLISAALVEGGIVSVGAATTVASIAPYAIKAPK